jgi:hypothetical protein
VNSETWKSATTRECDRVLEGRQENTSTRYQERSPFSDLGIIPFAGGTGFFSLRGRYA